MELNHLNPDEIGRGLSLSGGGVRGIFTASVLASLESRIRRDIPSCFDVFVGTSVGGIIALALACEVPASSILKILFQRSPVVFGDPAWWNPRNMRVARHEAGELRSVIVEVLGDWANSSIRNLKKNVVITSVNANTNQTVIFSNVSRIGNVDCHDASLVDVALATSAAPTFLPPHKIGNEYFLDGGIVSNNPDLETLRFLHSHLSRPLESAMVLSVATGSTSFDFEIASRSDAGGLSWLAKHRLIDRIISLQESKSSDIVSELLGRRYLRIDALFDEKIELDETDVKVLGRLRDQGAFVANSNWDADPSKMASFLR